jgi:hypothetical protein
LVGKANKQTASYAMSLCLKNRSKNTKKLKLKKKTKQTTCLAHYSHYFFGLCNEPNNKNAESDAAAAAATHYYWPTRWRIFTDLLLLLLQQMGLSSDFPNFVSNLKT